VEAGADILVAGTAIFGEGIASGDSINGAFGRLLAAVQR